MSTGEDGIEPPSVPAGRRPPGYEDLPDVPEAPTGAVPGGGGASWSPSAFGTTSLGRGFSPAGTRAASVERRYGRDARSPLPELALVVATVVVAYGLSRVMARTPAGATGGPSSRWRNGVGGLVLQLEEPWTYRPGDRGWAVLAGVAAGLVAVVFLVRRIGLNAPAQHRFGAALALGGLLLWWTLPLTLIEEVRTVDGALARQCLVLFLLIINVAVLRAWLASKIWSAGHLPGAIASVLTWVPMLAGVGWLVIVDLWGLVEYQDRGSRGVRHESTPTIVDWAARLNRASWISLAVLVVVVAVVQHLGIVRDRRDQARAEDEDREAGVHRLGDLGPNVANPRV